MFQEVLYAKKPLSKTGGTRVSPERKAWVKKQSAIILAQNTIAREKAKEEIVNRRREKDLINEVIREERLQDWSNRMRNSPFAVDLVAESERIIEENEVKAMQELMRKNEVASRRLKAKNEIVLKALSDFSDLEVLRKEKRAIMEEEQRLKALLALEKVNSNRKASRMAAMNAQRQRHQAKSEDRRTQYRDTINFIQQEESLALQKKSGLPLEPTKKFQSSFTKNQSFDEIASSSV